MGYSIKKGKQRKFESSPSEPSIEVRQELAFIYIQRLRKRNIEPTIEDIVNKYLISEKLAGNLLAQEPSRAQRNYDIFLPPHID